jgi:hypothetical protein
MNQSLTHNTAQSKLRRSESQMTAVVNTKLPKLVPVFFFILPTFLPPSFLQSFLPSFIPSFIPSYLPSFLPSFLPFFLSSFLPFFLSSFLPSFLSFFLSF